MNNQELSQLSKEELQTKLMASRQQVYHVREEILRGKEKNHAQLKSLRADVARIATVLAKVDTK